MDRFIIEIIDFQRRNTKNKITWIFYLRVHS